MRKTKSINKNNYQYTQRVNLFWQFLRRNKKYQNDFLSLCIQLKNPDFIDKKAVIDKFENKWRVNYLCDPKVDKIDRFFIKIHNEPVFVLAANGHLLNPYIASSPFSLTVQINLRSPKSAIFEYIERYINAYVGYLNPQKQKKLSFEDYKEYLEVWDLKFQKGWSYERIAQKHKKVGQGEELDSVVRNLKRQVSKCNVLIDGGCYDLLGDI